MLECRRELNTLGVRQSIVAGVEDACGMMEVMNGDEILHQYTDGHLVPPKTPALQHSDSHRGGLGTRDSPKVGPEFRTGREGLMDAL